MAAQVWPKDALEAVAYKFLKEMDLDDPTRVKLVELCQSVHRKVSSLVNSILAHDTPQPACKHAFSYQYRHWLTGRPASDSPVSCR